LPENTEALSEKPGPLLMEKSGPQEETPVKIFFQKMSGGWD
jgi:hypothetical protein